MYALRVHAPCAPYPRFLHQLTMPVVVCVARKLRPCPSYSRRRDHIYLGLLHILDKGGGVRVPWGQCSCSPAEPVLCSFNATHCVTESWQSSEFGRATRLEQRDCSPPAAPPCTAARTVGWMTPPRGSVTRKSYHILQVRFHVSSDGCVPLTGRERLVHSASLEFRQRVRSPHLSFFTTALPGAATHDDRCPPLSRQLVSHTPTEGQCGIEIDRPQCLRVCRCGLLVPKGIIVADELSKWHPWTVRRVGPRAGPEARVIATPAARVV